MGNNSRGKKKERSKRVFTTLQNIDKMRKNENG